MEYTSKWSKEIADSVRDKLKELQIPRYKYMVQVVVGERKSQGVRMGCRCLWDSETDNLASAEFSNVRVFLSLFSFLEKYSSFFFFLLRTTGNDFLHVHRLRSVSLLSLINVLLFLCIILGWHVCMCDIQELVIVVRNCFGALAYTPRRT